MFKQGIVYLLAVLGGLLLVGVVTGAVRGPLDSDGLGDGCGSYLMCEDEAEAADTKGITAFGDGGGNLAIVTSNGHGLEVGAEVLIYGVAPRTEYNDTFIILAESTNTFTIDVGTTFVGTDTGDWLTSGACASADGTAQVQLGGRGYAWTFVGTQSVDAYTCDVYGNDTGYTVVPEDKQKLTSASLTESNQMVSLEGILPYTWVQCSAITTTATVTAWSCPL